VSRRPHWLWRLVDDVVLFVLVTLATLLLGLILFSRR
jgi:hypothetical protein